MAYGLKTRIWQTGALEWWGYIGSDEVYLGAREFPLPPQEGDSWTVKATGDRFTIRDGEICRQGTGPPVAYPWETP